jgi:hypothetical protein
MEMDTYDRCEKNDLYPHFNSSLFNAIMMAIFYSQYSRRLLLSQEINNIYKSLITAYYTGKGNIQKILSKINPDEILMKILFESDKEKEKIIKDIKTFNQSNKSSPIKFFVWDTLFLRKFYKFLGINCMSMAYIRDTKDKCLLNFDDNFSWNINADGSFLPEIKKNIIKYELSTPDVIIVYHSDLFKSIEILKKMPTDEYKGFKMKSVDEKIEFNGETYILDSSILNTSTVGITDDNTKKVFNSWKLSNYQLSLPCSLKTYEWDVNKDETFCFNPNECEMDLYRDIEDISELCFNFGKGSRTLVYIRENKLKEVSDEKINSFKKKKEILEYPDIKEKIDEIKLMKQADLIKAINELSPNDQITQTDDKYSKENLEKRYLELFLEQNSKKISKPLNELIKPNPYLPKEVDTPENPPEQQSGGNNHLSREQLLNILKRNPKNKGLSSLNKKALMSIYLNNLRNRT